MTWQVTVDGGELSFFTDHEHAGTPLDVTLAELAVELFFPADAATEERLRACAGRQGRRCLADLSKPAGQATGRLRAYRVEERQGVLAPSRAGSRPDQRCPPPKNLVPASRVTMGLVNRNTTRTSIRVVRPRV